MARQLEGIKKFNDGLAEQEKLRDKLFDTPNKAAGVFGPGINSTSYAGCAAASPGLARGSP